MDKIRLVNRVHVHLVNRVSRVIERRELVDDERRRVGLREFVLIVEDHAGGFHVGSGWHGRFRWTVGRKGHVNTCAGNQGQES